MSAARGDALLRRALDFLDLTDPFHRNFVHEANEYLEGEFPQSRSFSPARNRAVRNRVDL